MQLAITLTIIATFLLVLSMFAIHRDLPGLPKGYRSFLSLLGSGIVTLFIGIGVYNHAQNVLRNNFSSVPRTVFKINTTEHTYVTALAGADAACLVTHLKNHQANIVDQKNHTIYMSLIQSLTATPNNLPTVTEEDCAFKPSRIVFTIQ